MSAALNQNRRRVRQVQPDAEPNVAIPMEIDNPKSPAKRTSRSSNKRTKNYCTTS